MVGLIRIGIGPNPFGGRNNPGRMGLNFTDVGVYSPWGKITARLS